MDGTNRTAANVIGGVNTHQDLLVAAIVDERDCVLGTRSFPTTRQCYRKMLAWMRTFGQLQRIGIESSGSYGAGLLRTMQAAGIEVMEVTAPDLIARSCIGHNSAAQLFLTAGDNPERLKSEGSIAALCGVSPLPASSGTGSIVAKTEPQTGRCTSLQSDGSEPMRRPGPKVRVAWLKDIPNRRLYVSGGGASPAFSLTA